MRTGFTVRVSALHEYRGNLEQFRSQAGTFADLVAKADVSDEAWGLVGLATKSSYTEALTQLNSLLNAVERGLYHTADRIRRAAELYEASDTDAARRLREFQPELNQINAAGPAGG